MSAPSPQEENRVEAAVGLAQRRIIAAMELERTPMARDLDHLNEQVKAKLEELNSASFTATGRFDTRRQMFEDEEREYLDRLPLQAFCPLDIRVLVVDRGHCVRISGDGHRYSMPPEYIGKRVSVTITDDKVYIYDLDSWVKIAEHKRYKNVQGNKILLLTEYMTDAERKYRRNLANGLQNLSRQDCRKTLPIVWCGIQKKEKPTFFAAWLTMP